MKRIFVSFVLVCLSAISATAQTNVNVQLSPDGTDAFQFQVDALNEAAQGADPPLPTLTLEEYVQQRLDAVQSSVIQEVTLAQAAVVQRAVQNSPPELQAQMAAVALRAADPGLTPEEIVILQRAFDQVLNPLPEPIR